MLSRRDDCSQKGARSSSLFLGRGIPEALTAADPKP